MLNAHCMNLNCYQCGKGYFSWLIIDIWICHVLSTSKAFLFNWHILEEKSQFIFKWILCFITFIFAKYKLFMHSYCCLLSRVDKDIFDSFTLRKERWLVYNWFGFIHPTASQSKLYNSFSLHLWRKQNHARIKWHHSAFHTLLNEFISCACHDFDEEVIFIAGLLINVNMQWSQFSAKSRLLDFECLLLGNISWNLINPKNLKGKLKSLRSV
jgi:hypothetical protein